ncbi:hypothetical protein BCR43DRAFT_481292 [Syncephalastrum racemosum]|uniref:Uncharacterized protein n=1 Tax=Syncephalastrum racemosum TaxID=13706 RepID=A0A1X2HS23_SYNRA|nr:hypothetical protein BCR43DRAFT_481292 [Syncephalastrum racemosum]
MLNRMVRRSMSQKMMPSARIGAQVVCQDHIASSFRRFTCNTYPLAMVLSAPIVMDLVVVTY